MLQIITTADGSASLYNSALNETYHSRKGAVAEAEYVYIEMGLKYLIHKGTTRFNIFEMGFGTGLNAILTYKEFLKQDNLFIHYTSIEKYPLAQEIAAQLVFPGITDSALLASVYRQLHSGPWDEATRLHERFIFKKITGDIKTFSPPKPFTIVYYDAFAPAKQPEVWTPGILQKVYSMMERGGALVTYCATGQLKRTLAQCGFGVQTLKGPPGKREMVRAIIEY